ARAEAGRSKPVAGRPARAKHQLVGVGANTPGPPPHPPLGVGKGLEGPPEERAPEAQPELLAQRPQTRRAVPDRRRVNMLREPRGRRAGAVRVREDMKVIER